MSQTPTVYFIDDSATMREVIKIAFRRENMNVVACHSGEAALSQMDHVAPDVVISDVIMPEKDGYEVCQHIKNDPRFNGTPVVLMSGVVNRAVAEKAFAVKADELIRKPFQPQDLITRVKHLLTPKSSQPLPPASVPAPAAAAALSSIFATPVTGIPMQARTASVATLPSPSARPTTPRFAPITAQSPIAGAPAARPLPRTVESAARPTAEMPPVASQTPIAATVRPNAPVNGNGMDLQKSRLEMMRLQGLVRKLQSELEAEREYSRALEEHIKTLQESD